MSNSALCRHSRSATHELSTCVCVWVCVCVWRKNNIKEGDPYGSSAPVVASGATKNNAAYSVCATLSGARRGRNWGPCLGQNLWWGGLM